MDGGASLTRGRQSLDSAVERRSTFAGVLQGDCRRNVNTSRVVRLVTSLLGGSEALQRGRDEKVVLMTQPFKDVEVDREAWVSVE